MLLALLLAAIGCASNPQLDPLRLTPDQMFHVQYPYRYHVQVGWNVWHKTLNRYEFEVSDLYANEITLIKIEAPVDPRAPRGTVTHLILKVEDGVEFPDDRFHCFTVLVLEHRDPVILNIVDRKEKVPIFPPAPEPDY